jgi:50S ribosomal protein L16 3-hydroxylase
MAGEDGVESRLIQQLEGDNWKLSHGPLSRRSLPALTKPGWTVLVQGVDMHDAKAHELLQQFRFVPEARLDDLMISFATDQGGVGPHFDSYDVFLLQAHGKRRWRIGRQKDLSLQQGKPLKILSNFEPEEEFVLEPGDMLYLPPKWAHDGVAEGECMTYSIGFRSPDRSELGRELLLRMSDEPDEPETPVIYRDPKQEAVSNPALIPEGMYDFAREALKKAMAEPLALERALGEYLSDPKPNVWFEHGDENGMFESVVLDRRTRMMYDAKHIFINGESYLAGGRDATLMRKLADTEPCRARIWQLPAMMRWSCCRRGLMLAGFAPATETGWTCNSDRANLRVCPLWLLSISQALYRLCKSLSKLCQGFDRNKFMLHSVTQGKRGLAR